MMNKAQIEAIDVADANLNNADLPLYSKVVSDRAELLAALRLFVSSAYPVSTDIDMRGYCWSDAYLDKAVEQARNAIARATNGD